MIAQTFTLLPDPKKDTKHTRYNNSEKGRARNARSHYKEYKKILVNRIASKKALIAQLEKELA